MSAGPETSAPRNGAEASRKAVEMIGHLRPRLKMADSWFRTILRLHLYFMRLKVDFRRSVKARCAQNDARDVDSNHALREGGRGGSFEDWNAIANIEKTLRDYGTPEDEDREMPDAHNAADSEDQSKSSMPGRSIHGTESPRSASARLHGWASINAVPSQANSAHRTSETSNINGTNGHYRPGFSTSNLPSPAGQNMSTGAGESVAPPNAMGGYAAQSMGGASGRDTVGYASVEDARSASMNLQQQVNSQPAPSADPMTGVQQPWTREMEHSWLESINTRFSGDDVAAFVEGGDWQEWAAMAARQSNPGWLSALWA